MEALARKSRLAAARFYWQRVLFCFVLNCKLSLLNHDLSQGLSTLVASRGAPQELPATTVVLISTLEVLLLRC